MVLDANGGIISTDSLMVGVASGGVGRRECLLAAPTGPIARSVPVVAGEWASAAFQAGAERATVSEWQEPAPQSREEPWKLTDLREVRSGSRACAAA